MKFDRNKAYPYPVLRPFSDDYIDVDFQTIVDPEIDNDVINTSIEYAISSEEIIDQIDNENAEYVSIIHCRDTYFRKVVKSSDRKVSVKFGTGELRGEVRVDPYVFVKKKIIDFSSPDINEEFVDKSFDFDVGDILAQDESQVFYIDRDLFKPVTAVFELVKIDGISGYDWSLNFSQDHVQIGVSALMKEKIDNARNSIKNRAILINSIYFSAVLQSIQKLKDTKEEYEDYKWASVIGRQAHNMNLDLDVHDAYESAQRLMNSPLSLLDAYVFDGE